jgi:hypothetical protein
VSRPKRLLMKLSSRPAPTRFPPTPSDALSERARSRECAAAQVG